MSGLTDNLEPIASKIRESFAAKDAAREQVLPLYREVIRHCGNAIRAVHRQEFEQGGKLLSQPATCWMRQRSVYLPIVSLAMPALPEMPARNLPKAASPLPW